MIYHYPSNAELRNCDQPVPATGPSPCTYPLEPPPNLASPTIPPWPSRPVQRLHTDTHTSQVTYTPRHTHVACCTHTHLDTPENTHLHAAGYSHMCSFRIEWRRSRGTTISTTTTTYHHHYPPNSNRARGGGRKDGRRTSETQSHSCWFSSRPVI